MKGKPQQPIGCEDLTKSHNAAIRFSGNPLFYIYVFKFHLTP